MVLYYFEGTGCGVMRTDRLAAGEGDKNASASSVLLLSAAG